MFGLNIGNGGEILPQIRINGKDGEIARTTYDDGVKGMEDIEDFAALFDFNTLKVGWMLFSPEKVDKRLVAIGDPVPDQPSEEHKQGIEMKVLLPGGLGVHELATSATGVMGALNTVYETTLRSDEWKAGQVPVVRLTEFQKEKTKRGSRAIPVFEIVDWKDRPADLEAHAAKPKPRAAMPSSAANDTPAETGSKTMEPPKAAANMDFG